MLHFECFPRMITTNIGGLERVASAGVTVACARFLKAPATMLRCVPLKSNGLQYTRAMVSTEEGYVFCGGRPRRDFRTLFDAVKDLPYPVKVVTSEESEMKPHGSTMHGLSVPPNVKIIRRDSDQAFFLDCMAR